MKQEPITVRTAQLAETLHALKDAGQQEKECVVLWLGIRTESGLVVKGVYSPVQYATSDRFHIPAEGMEGLMKCLREIRGMVVAQVHSHPHEAFHSLADDEWAIVRHESAISIVVPEFGRTTSVDDFFYSSKTFSLIRGTWTELDQLECAERYRIVDE